MNMLELILDPFCAESHHHRHCCWWRVLWWVCWERKCFPHSWSPPVPCPAQSAWGVHFTKTSQSPSTSALFSSALHSFWECSFFILTLDLKSVPPYLWNLYFYTRGVLRSANIYAVWWGDMIALVPNRLESKLQRNTEYCFVQSPRKKVPFIISASNWREKGENRLVTWELRGSQEVDLECLSHSAVIRLGHTLVCLCLQHACLPCGPAGKKTVGWLLWELMGAAGSGKWKVLRIDPEIPEGQNFPLPGFPTYFSLIWSAHSLLTWGGHFQRLVPGVLRRVWRGLSQADCTEKEGYTKDCCFPMSFCYSTWLRGLQWTQDWIDASVSFYTVKECAPDKERGTSVCNSRTTVFSSLLPPALTKKGGRMGSILFLV